MSQRKQRRRVSAKAATASEAPGKIETTRSRVAGWWVKIFAGLGLLHLYAILNNYQDIVQLSESVKQLAAWWHYFIQVLFEWLNIHIEQWRRETLILFLFATSITNVSYYKERGRFLFIVVAKASSEKEERFGLFPRDKTIWDVVVSQSVSFAFLSVCAWPFHNLPSWFLPPVLLMMLAYIFFEVYSRLPNAMFRILRGLCGLLAFPLLMINQWVFALTYYRWQILKSLRYLLLILAADVIARYAVDPLIKVWLTLPNPPV